MTTKQPRTSLARQAKDKTAMTSEPEKGVGTVGTTLDQLLIKLNADNERFRQADKKAHSENLKMLSDKLEALQLAQMKSLEAQRTSIKTPLPKYAGKVGEFDDWKAGVINCIKTNDWRDEKRVLEMIPGCLTGPACRVYNSLPDARKRSLEALFAALKESLDPTCKTLNRELFIKAKRNPGESMRSFISRCNQYIMRADEIDNIAESPWANSFVVEKIFANLAPWDRKILKSTVGKSEEVQMLCEKADELLALSEDVVGSLHQEGIDRPWNSQPPQIITGAYNNQQHIPQDQNGWYNGGRNQWHSGWHNAGPNGGWQQGWQWQNQPAGRTRRGRPKRYPQPNNIHRSRPGGGGNPSGRENAPQKQKANERQTAPIPAIIPLN